MQEFKLQIHTPDRVFFNDMAEQLVVNTTRGSMGVMHGTMPILTILSKGSARILSGSKWMEAVIGDGFLEVRNNVVSILVGTCRWQYEAEPEHTEEEELNEIEKHRQSLKEYQLAKAQLIKQLARLHIKSSEN